MRGREIVVINRAELLSYDIVNSLVDLPSDKVIALSRVLHKGATGYQVIKLGRIKGLRKGMGHPRDRIWRTTPREVVKEAYLSPVEAKTLMLMSVLGPRVRGKWFSREVRGSKLALPTLRRKALVSRSGEFYVVDPVVRRGVDIDSMVVDAIPSKLQDVDEIAYPMIKHYAESGSYEKVERILFRWLRTGNLKLFFEDASRLVATLSTIPKSEIVRAALAKAYAPLYDFLSARRELASLGEYRALVENSVEYMAHNFGVGQPGGEDPSG